MLKFESLEHRVKSLEHFRSTVNFIPEDQFNVNFEAEKFKFCQNLGFNHLKEKI